MRGYGVEHRFDWHLVSRFRQPLLALWVFTILLISSVLSGGIGLATHVAISIWTPSDEALLAFGPSDAGSYLQAALGLRDRGPWGIAGNQWVYNFWPPGMVVVNLLVLLAEAATSIPYTFLLVATSALVLAIIFTRVLNLVWSRSRRVGTGTFVGLSLSSLFYPFASVNVGYADMLAASFLILAAVELWSVRDMSSNSARRALLRSGVYLAIAMHFRATFETLVTLMLVVGFLLWFAVFALSRIRGRDLATSLRRVAAQLTALGLFAQLLSVPWRLIAGMWIRPGDFRWSQVLDTSWGARWTPTRIWEAQGYHFLIGGRANYGCLVDGETCDFIAGSELGTAKPYSGEGFYSQSDFRDFLLQSVLANPLNYLGERLLSFFRGFFSETGAAVGSWDIPEATLLMVIFLFSFVLFARDSSLRSTGAWFSLFSAASLSAIVLVFHMETRYLLPVKLSMLVFCAMVLADFSEQRKRDK